jgi:hypothetical protein
MKYRPNPSCRKRQLVANMIMFIALEEDDPAGVRKLTPAYAGWFQVNELDDKPGYLAEVLVVMVLDVTYQEITDAEDWLTKNSASLNGKNDGWEVQDKLKTAGNPEFFDLPASQT